MTIKNFTFFSPNGTEFPVGSNNDGKLYMMLTGLEYDSIRRKDWANTLRTALNIQYVNTSIVAGGRYFELINETVALQANATNYIHANIDLTQTTTPVSLSAESTDNGNAIDLNNSSGVFKVVIDIVTTNGQGVISQQTPKRVTVLDEIKASKASISNVETDSFSLSTNIPWTSMGVAGSFWKKEFNTITLRWDTTKSGTDGDFVLGSVPSQYAPVSGIMNIGVAWRGSDISDCRLQLDGGSSGGKLTLLGAKSGQAYRGQLKYDI